LSTSAVRINSDANTLTLNNTITNGAIDLTIGGAGDCVVSNVIGSGAGAFTKDGAGTVNLNATNTYTGVTTVNAGSVLLGANQALSNNLVINVGTFDVTASNYSLSLTGNFTNSGTFNARNGTVTFNGASAQTVAGTVDAAFYNLTMNNSSTGVAIGLNTSVTNTLNFNDGNLTTQGYTLTIGNTSANGSITNADASKYIIAYNNAGTIGSVKRNVNSNASYDFPIGDNANYTPQTITLNSNGGLTTASITSYTKASKITEMASDVTTYINREWVNSSSGITSPNYDVEYTYVGTDVVGTEADLLPVNYESTANWQKPTGSLFTTGSEAGTGTVNTGSKKLTWTGISKLARLTAAGNSAVPLPVMFVDVNAKIAHNQVKIVWITAYEINNQYFTIEISKDGIHFDSIGVVQAEVNTSFQKQYSFMFDCRENTVHYFRIKQTDLDGKFSYSKMIVIGNETNNKEIIGIYNLQGQEVEATRINGLLLIKYSDGSVEKVWKR